MQQIPSWEANRFSATQAIPRILWNPNVYYRIHKCPLTLPVLTQLDPVHSLTSKSLKIRLNVIISPTPLYSKWSLSLRFPHQSPVYKSPLPHICYMSRPSHFSLFYHPNNIGWAVQINNLIIILFFPPLFPPPS